MPYLIGAVLSLVFYAVLFKICLFLWRQPRQPAAEEGVLIRHDVPIAFLLYAAATVLFFLPIWSSFSQVLIGPPEDNMQHFWTLWWGKKALLTDAHFFFTPMLFYPQGTSLLYHAWSFYGVALFVLLDPVFGAVASYNLIILHSFVVAGVGAFLLAKHYVRDSRAAWLAGFLYAFNPSHYAHALHHLEQSCGVQFLPFAILFFLRAVEKATLKRRLLASTFFLLTALSSLYYFFYAGLFVGLYYFYELWREKRFWLRDLFVSAMAAVLPAMAALFPWLISMITFGALHRQELQRYEEAAAPGVIDGLAPFIPSAYHWAGPGGVFARVVSFFSANDWEKTGYLGVVSIVLVLAVSRKVTRRYAPLALAFLTFLLFSMGPWLHLLGQSVGVPLPWLVLERIPFFSAVRVPSRIIIVAYLFWSVLVGASFLELARSKKDGFLGKAGPAVMALLLVVDFFPHRFEKTDAAVSVGYSHIPEGSGAILNLPLLRQGAGYASDARSMMDQTSHGLPIMNGYTSRTVGKLLIDEVEMKDLAAQKKQLIANRVGTIAIHKQFPSTFSENERALYRKMYKPVYEDEDILVLEVET